MRGRKIIAVIFAVMLVFMAGCGKEEDLTGRWVCTDEGSSESMELFSDGTGTFIENGESNTISWIAENGRLKISRSLGLLGESSGTFDFELKKDKLVIYSEDGETQNFERE